MDIKLKKESNNRIKVLDKASVANEKFKENIVSISTKDNNQSNNEYAANALMKSYEDSTIINTYSFNKYGKKSFSETKKNINKVKDKIKEKNEIKKANKIKSNRIKIKINKATNNKVNEETIKGSKKAFQIGKCTTKKIMVGIKATIKASILSIKGMISATQYLIEGLVAGGWIVVSIIVVICMVAILLTSLFGIFFTNETNPTRTMTSVISEVNQEVYQHIEKTKLFYDYDDYVIESSYTNWKEVIVIYAVKYSEDNQGINVTTLDELNVSRLKSIYYQMNQITTYFTEEKTNDIKINRILHLKLKSKSKEEIMQYYKFTELQKKEVNNLLSKEYEPLWQNLIYGSNDGNAKLVEIARQEIENKGGEKFWRWYGFNQRVNWCAIFVSWVANEAGVLNLRVPKFSLVSDGVNWYKLNGRWKDKTYTPNLGDIIFFDWELDGKVNHVGIVDRVENGIVYTIEGNSTGDKCLEKNYKINENIIYGYGSTK